MSSLAWLRYLSHTQVIESSNLSSSIQLNIISTYFEQYPLLSTFEIIKESKS